MKTTTASSHNLNETTKPDMKISGFSDLTAHLPDQQRLVAGMLDKANLLDLIRIFTLFSTDNKGRTIKIVGRYQQFRAC
jgi:type I site-specific restriction-modification system R (restriction) subunit